MADCRGFASLNRDSNVQAFLWQEEVTIYAKTFFTMKLTNGPFGQTERFQHWLSFPENGDCSTIVCPYHSRWEVVLRSVEQRV
jgi:hypothetical protein